MNSVFYIHLISTVINIFFLITLWWYNRTLMSLNPRLINDNVDILVEVKKLQERMNDLENKTLLPKN
jgi:hypothetical protein